MRYYYSEAEKVNKGKISFKEFFEIVHFPVNSYKLKTKMGRMRLYTDVSACIRIFLEDGGNKEKIDISFLPKPQSKQEESDMKTLLSFGLKSKV